VTAPPPAAQSPAAAPPPACGPDQATALQSALAQLPPEPVTGTGRQTTTIGSDYNPCADLSTILVTIQGGTASSPVQALMFHRGTFLVLDYKTPGECNACAPAAVTSVRYQWQGDHVEMLDPPPPS
jgi:hypothetical protein